MSGFLVASDTRAIKGLFIAVGFLLCALSLPAADGHAPWPEDLTEEQRYWRKLHAVEEQQFRSDEERIREARQQVLTELGETRAAGDAFQAQVVLEQDGPRAVAQPSWFAGKEDYVLWSSAGLLIAALLVRTGLRHRREAEIRALSGGYLSDGTEVADYKLPEWFAPPPPAQPRVDESVGLDANRSIQETVVNEAVVNFFAEAPQVLSSISESLRALVAEKEPSRREQFLRDLSSLLADLTEKANSWELRPAWQMSSALHALVDRIARKPKDVTESALRTIAAALDLLHKVCAPGVRPNLLIDPPVKIMAVDDEPLCRRALQFAFEKAKLTADIAQTGEEAIQLAMNRAYDIVLMDIQMPGIDGFAACRRIHQTQRNPDVPVVFVTVLSDFNTRAKSRLEGGVDLIAKPYLILELTVKTMTYIMRKRLRAAASGEAAEALQRTIAPVLQLQSAVESRDAEPSAACSVETEPTINEIIDSGTAGLQGEFLTVAPGYLARTRKLIEAARSAPDSENIERVMGALYLRVHRFAEQASTDALPVAAHVSSTLESLLKRLYHNRNAITVSTINTASHALKLLHALCRPGIEAVLAGHPPLRFLVVDDEPLARRAVVGALQLAFEKPDSAANGAEALALAAKNSYDVIFSDIQMPEIDGFEFCSELRSGGVNQQTPLIFITAFKDSAAQAQALECGGNDFISKPFLPIEITVKALTFAMERRLRRQPGAGSTPSPSLASARSTSTAASEAQNPLAVAV